MIFHVNQRVICIDAGPSDSWRKWLADAPVVGQVYTVASLSHLAGWGAALVLVEIKNQRVFNYAYAARRFRPAVERKTDISIFTSMLHPSPQKVLDHIMSDTLADIYLAADK